MDTKLRFSKRREQGYTMVELMVSITIALFLLAGLTTLVMHTRQSSATQSQMAQLQDNERMAMTILTDVIQQAGYFPDPTQTTATSVFSDTSSAPISTTPGSFSFGLGQVLSGAGSGSPSDSIAVRFASPMAYATDTNNYLTSSIANCAGTSVKDTTASHVFANVFQIATDANNTTYLQCLLYEDGTFKKSYNLVPGLYAMQVLYGLAQSGGADNNVITYVAASSLTTTALWQSVTSVRMRLYFQLPQYGFTGGQVDSNATSSAVNNKTMYIERIIPIMSQSGG